MTKHRIPRNLYAPKYWATWIGLGLLRSLSYLPYRWMLILSNILGTLFFPLARRRKNIIETNINVCFPEKSLRERKLLARKAFISTIMAIFEISLSWWRSQENIRQLHNVDGMQHLENAIQKGKGVILLVSHFTTMEIAGAFLNSHIANLNVVYKRSNNELLEWFIHHKRLEKCCAALIKHKNVREIVRRIKAGDIVWYAPDQDFGDKDSVFAPFMGIMTSTLVSTQRLAKLTGASVVPFYVSRSEKEPFYTVHFSPALENFPGNDDVADATTVNRAIEYQVRQNPEQYLWAHRRFKSRPPGEDDIYTKHFGLIRYRFLLLIAFVPLLIYTAWKSFHAAEFRYFLQRFSLLYSGTVTKPGIWIHAASVGEINAAIPLIHKIHIEHPATPITITTNTMSSAAIAQKQLPAPIQHIYFPLDYHLCIKRIITKINPKAVFIIETEIWPNLYIELYKRDVPLTIINGRISEKTLNASHWLIKLYAQILPLVTRVYTRSETDKTRFIALGSPRDKIEVIGNIKFAVSTADDIKAINLNRSYVLAASTREDEERLIVEAWLKSERANHLLVIVPRHPQRLNEIVKQLSGFKLNIAVRSKKESVTPQTDIYIADTMGELRQFIAGAMFVLMGGSFVEKGGHNILEVAQLGKAVIFGPDMRSFTDEAELFLEYNTGVQSDLAALPVYFNRLIQDNEFRNEIEKNTALLITTYNNVMNHYYKVVNQYIPIQSQNS